MSNDYVGVIFKGDSKLPAKEIVAYGEADDTTARDYIDDDPNFTDGDVIFLRLLDGSRAKKEGFATDDGLGGSADAASAVGGVGSINAKLRLISEIVAGLPTSLTGADNFKAAIVEALPVGANVIGKVQIDQVTFESFHIAAGLSLEIGATTNSINIEAYPYLTIFGDVSGATTLTIQVSNDDVNYYDGDTIVLSGAGSFKKDCTLGAGFIKIKSSAAITLNCFVGAKS